VIQHGKPDAHIVDLGVCVSRVLACHGTFELDHLGPGFGQHERRHRAGKKGAEIQHQNVLEWLRHRFCLM